MIRFVSEGGTGMGTKLLDAVTGQDLSSIVSVEFGATIEIGELVRATCKICMVEVDIVADKTEFLTKHPVTGGFEAVKAIEFQDGSCVTFAEDGTPSLRSTISVAEMGTGRIHNFRGKS